MAGSASLKLVLTVFMLLLASVTGSAHSRGPAEAETPATISIAEMPAQGSQTYQLIVQGGPFPYEKDGMVFGNRERLLPGNSRGYYREYTVNTPGIKHRGMRRIVCGGAPKSPDSCYYTADHYSSFRRIVP